MGHQGQEPRFVEMANRSQKLPCDIQRRLLIIAYLARRILVFFYSDSICLIFTFYQTGRNVNTKVKLQIFRDVLLLFTGIWTNLQCKDTT